jgi:exonuclease SbcC
VLQQAIARLEERLSRLEKIAAEALESRRRRDELHLELDLLSNLERACGPNGVPAMILENVAIPQIETEANRILSLLGGPAQAVELRTLREKKTGGLADTLDIVLLTETGERAYETFSGGEKARISFALRLALAQLLASRTGSETGLLVIDELEGLDNEGVAALTDILRDLEGKIRTILVVSHNAELRDAFEKTLEIEKVGGRSRIVGHDHERTEVPA